MGKNTQTYRLVRSLEKSVIRFNNNNNNNIYNKYSDKSK